ncbi:MAG: hypothetical protein AAGC46_02805 [Solirubrobacteraceae bacterium]|nr:hypothetical protein [Patulibacter sp.]
MFRLASVVAAAAVLALPGVAHADLTLLAPIQPRVVAFHGASYFVDGSGLYRTDGTPAGTHLALRASSSDPSRIQGLAVDGDALVFTTTLRGGHADVLYRSDGTAAGTIAAIAAQRVATSRRAAAKPKRRLYAGPPIVAGSQLYVQAGYGLAHQAMLYRVDRDTGAITPVGGGLPALAYPITPIAASADGGLFLEDRGLWHVPPTGDAVRLGTVGGSLSLGTVATIGNTLFFAGNDALGDEPWLSDGTPAGTHRIADLTPGSASSTLSGFLPVGGSMYVLAGDGTGEPTPYLLGADGSATPVTDGGVPVRVLRNGTDGGVGFSDDALWLKGGTYATPVRLRVPAGSTVAEHPTGAGFDENGVLVVPGTRFAFSGTTLRSIDAAGSPTILGTVALPFNEKAGPEPTFDQPFLVGNDLWFSSSVFDGRPAVLWRSDGTPAGTHPVVDPGQIDPVASTLAARATPRRITRAPYRWTITGTIYPDGLLPADAPRYCSGSVALTLTRYGGNRVLHRFRTRVRWNGHACVFRGTVSPSRSALAAGRGRLAVGPQLVRSPHIAPWTHVPRVGLHYR